VAYKQIGFSGEKPKYRPYDDGIRDRAWRRKMRQDAYKDTGKRKPLKGTERLCSKCHKWFKVDDVESWCEHLRRVETESDAPNVHEFKPFYHPNIQPGGAWIRSASEYKKAQILCGKEPVHG
jgi:hypothetical protein